MTSTFTAKLTRGLSLGIALVIVLLPFHAFLTVWLAGALGHYTLLRLWKECILLAIGLVATVLFLRDGALRKQLWSKQLFWLIGWYVLLQLFLGFTAAVHHQVSAKALAYGLLDDTRYLLFFVLCAVIAMRDDWLQKHWRPLVLGPAAVVVVFGLLQITVLPTNFLSHFGYGPGTIPAVETVNSNAHYVRIASTLRGANPFGAYLILILAVLAVDFIQQKTTAARRLAYGLGGLATLIVLYFSYSRGAWIGAALALGCIATKLLKTKRTRQTVLLGSAALIIVVAAGAWSLRNNTHFKNVVFHSSPHTVATTSDQNHDSALKQGLHDVEHDPLGRGPGTAGPASVYNHDRPARVPEDYFVQIGQELGWLGLLLYILITALVFVSLVRVRSDSLALALLASLIGLTFVSLVSEIWTDDTISYLWWGLAGMVLAATLPAPKQSKHQAKH